MIVDDVTLSHSNTFDTDADLLIAQMHRDLSIWGEYLEATGGLLEYSKTKYTMGAWKFNPDGTLVILKENELPTNSITIKETAQKTTTTKRACASKPLKMQGVQT
eukprot:6959869-Ditylum_brightwellii.AAC.1